MDIHFTPFEDVMGIGHSLGVSSIIVPGSGEPNFDSFENNPYQTNKQIREATVHSLLEKVSLPSSPNLAASILTQYPITAKARDDYFGSYRYCQDGFSSSLCY